MRQLIILLFAVALFPFHFSSCIEEGAEVLPEATMEGKNTFGCLVNGEVWLPKGYAGYSNLDISYDPYYAGGAFGLSTYRLIDESNEQYIYIFDKC